MDAIRNIPAILAISLVLAGLLISFVCKARRPPLPPGPRGWPIVGNIFNLPPRGDPLPWLGYKDSYGLINSVTVLGQTIILINDLQATIDLLDKRSSIYSGRPIFPFGGSMVGWDQQLILAQYGDHFRAMRKMMKTYLGSPSAITNFRHIQELETRYFLTRILDDPANLISHIRWTAGAISLRISHGYIIETDQPDPLVDLVETAAKDFYAITMPGAWLVDIFPIMKYLPDWMPFKQAAATYRSHNLEQTERPHSFVKNRMRAGTELPSFTSDMMSTGPDEATEHAVKYAATAIYGGASDTTVAALSAFMLLMLLYPDVQKRARDELDSVVGNKRLPNFDDRPSLPYLEATMKEVMRWHSTGRIGIPHRALQDDIYNGYLIPKDSIILPHVWHITHDPQLYSDPLEFRPERFLPSEGYTPELDPKTYMFGFGKRVCPGKDLANANMFIATAMTLSVFEISKGKDENGIEIEPRCEFEGGTVSHPLPFAFTLKPRSPEAEDLIRIVNEEAPRRPSDGPYL
ncbi:O-methylsterigmatocystin oxidoreductase [Termitomyces sp. T112]|nr:O-methylsterigmatocystin oxidoreductase [Termitomyces sp. T112]